jgi:AMP deaminase
MGKPILRELFLKTDNFLNGRYLAELTKKVFSNLEENKYVYTGKILDNFINILIKEWRISIYGKSIDEWEKLSKWIL